VLGFLLRMGWQIGYWEALGWLIAYGGFIEFSQLFAIHRSAEWADIGADAVGALLGLKAYKLLQRVF
jgi:VanZ family protein